MNYEFYLINSLTNKRLNQMTSHANDILTII